jgi:hypothetical protein
MNVKPRGLDCRSHAGTGQECYRVAAFPRLSGDGKERKHMAGATCSCEEDSRVELLLQCDVLDVVGGTPRAAGDRVSVSSPLERRKEGEMAIVEAG